MRACQSGWTSWEGVLSGRTSTRVASRFPRVTVSAMVNGSLMCDMAATRMPPTSLPPHFTVGSPYKVKRRPIHDCDSVPQPLAMTRRMDLLGLYGRPGTSSRSMNTG